ncbi:hypothetical protein IGB42_01066 [Andreprevotia sp. IGB-42]|uniref:hypothetical protein n=1 Tax=Andreprevotia sp. IGB-42 TaxID=2497473 RepID=UPI001357AB5D|nr:hypothetical protein [Andreprevotia sp. IGB-42]KAF0814169.1 hypothetical protein IGB42_01066 [Andreprevotia sp. IGB-42]
MSGGGTELLLPWAEFTYSLPAQSRLEMIDQLRAIIVRLNIEPALLSWIRDDLQHVVRSERCACKVELVSKSLYNVQVFRGVVARGFQRELHQQA